MHGKKWLWRWRRNPLKRRWDVLEARLLLTTALVMAVGGSTVGVATAQSVDGSLLHPAQRHGVQAVLLDDAHRPRPTAGDPTGTDQVRALVQWTAADGSVHRGMARVDGGQQAGSRVTIWLDDHGRPSAQPFTHGEAGAQSALAGTLGGGAFCGLVLLGQRGVRVRLDRGRDQQWERAWAEVEPQWSHRRT